MGVTPDFSATATMGKKSKAKASNSADKRDALALAGAPAPAGGISKKQRCISCLALLKDLAKAHQCPGCSLLYCWRCEKKNFGICLNREECLQPKSRCFECISGKTMAKALHAAGIISAEEADCKLFVSQPSSQKAYQSIVDQGNDLTHFSWPMCGCGGVACKSSTEKFFECIDCAKDVDTVHNLGCCCRCGKLRCPQCLADQPYEDVANMLVESREIIESNKGVRVHPVMSTAAIEKVLSAMTTGGTPDGMTACMSCSRLVCRECIDFTEASKVCSFAMGRPARGETHQFQCSKCYWSSKPCTNPKCPNEIGVQTKRCGGCHIDRYCSVECQVEAYPEHNG